MSTGFLTLENIAERITANAIGPAQHFASWIDSRKRDYYEVSPEMEPDIDLFWGYCFDLNAFFISQNVKMSVKTAILQMEEYRFEQGKPHAEAVAFAVAQHHTYRRLFIETLLRFYLAKQESLPESLPDMDINATVEFLQQCPR